MGMTFSVVLRQTGVESLSLILFSPDKYIRLQVLRFRCLQRAIVWQSNSATTPSCKCIGKSGARIAYAPKSIAAKYPAHAIFRL